MFIISVFKRYSTYIFAIILSSYIGTANAMEERDTDPQPPSCRERFEEFGFIEFSHIKLENKQHIK